MNTLALGWVSAAKDRRRGVAAGGGRTLPTAAGRRRTERVEGVAKGVRGAGAKENEVLRRETESKRRLGICFPREAEKREVSLGRRWRKKSRVVSPRRHQKVAH